MHIKFTCKCGNELDDFTRGSVVQNGELPADLNIPCLSCDRRYLMVVAEVPSANPRVETTLK